MLMQGALSAYLRDTAGSIADPLHGHSFSPVTIRLLSAVDRSLLFFRDCLVCRERLLSIGKPQQGKRRRLGSASQKLPPVLVPKTSICQCLTCGKFAHRACVSFTHLHRCCRGHKSLMPVCSHSPPLATALLLPQQSEATNPRYNNIHGPMNLPTKKLVKGSSFTLATLLEELNSSTIAAAHVPSAVLVHDRVTSKQQHLHTASKFAKKLMPVLAAGGVVGAIAMGPAAGVLAGLNMLVMSIGAETVMAGIGLTASAAAAATVMTHQSHMKAAHRKKEKLWQGEWAMAICWHCQSHFEAAMADEMCRKDIEFLRRFQLHEATRDVTTWQHEVDTQSGPRTQMVPEVDRNSGPRTQMVPEVDRNSGLRSDTVPGDLEIYRFLFGIFASPRELLGQMNVQLCAAFRQRFTARHQLRRRRSSFTGKTNASDAKSTRVTAQDTLQDAKMYVAHVLGATLQCFPSLASTRQALSSCSLAVERIVFDDIYAMVFSEFQLTFQDADAAFAENLATIRHKPTTSRSSACFYQPIDKSFQTEQELHLVDELQVAEATLVTMMHETSSPLLKLVLLCDAFRRICTFAEKLHQATSNADMLIPILCAFLVECPRICGPGLDFVAAIAFISFFTNGGGKGVEGYVLTTFQASIQVITAVDMLHGHGQELELILPDEIDTDDDEFVDAVEVSRKFEI